MIRTTRKILHISLGLFLVCFGILGLVLPIINGTVLLILGFVIISFESVYVERKLNHFTRRYEATHKIHRFLDDKLRKLFK